MESKGIKGKVHPRDQNTSALILSDVWQMDPNKQARMQARRGTQSGRAPTLERCYNTWQDVAGTSPQNAHQQHDARPSRSHKSDAKWLQYVAVATEQTVAPSGIPQKWTTNDCAKVTAHKQNMPGCLSPPEARPPLLLSTWCSPAQVFPQLQASREAVRLIEARSNPDDHIQSEWLYNCAESAVSVYRHAHQSPKAYDLRAAVSCTWH